MHIKHELAETAWALVRAIDDADYLSGIDADGRTHLALMESDISGPAERLRDVLLRLEALERAAS
jgi:hypothetical protein